MTPYGEYRIDLRQYLLGKVSEEARRQVELLLLTDNGLFEEVTLLEEELIDDYVKGGLAPTECTSFEQYFLSTPERHDKLKAARALRAYAASSIPAAGLLDKIRALWNTHRMQLSLATSVALVLLIVGGFLVFRDPQTPQAFVALQLTMTASDRGSATLVAPVSWPLNADALRVTLALPEAQPPAENYKVELVNERGEVKTLQITSRSNQALVVDIPAAQLAPGQYALRLYGVQSSGAAQRINGSYFFNIKAP
jgi:hypothetical protein